MTKIGRFQGLRDGIDPFPSLLPQTFCSHTKKRDFFALPPVLHYMHYVFICEIVAEKAFSALTEELRLRQKLRAEMKLQNV